MDDAGVVRLNRGFRIQYSSSLGPYEGPLHLGSHVNGGLIKALGFDNVFSNGLTGYDVGSSVGGSDFNPFDKSEAEVQRFCQSYMTELAKYVGPDIDHPTMGMGVAEKEMGYLFGQYKRLSSKSTSGGIPFMARKDSDVSYLYYVDCFMCYTIFDTYSKSFSCHLLDCISSGSWACLCPLCQRDAQRH